MGTVEVRGCGVGTIIRRSCQRTTRWFWISAYIEWTWTYYTDATLLVAAPPLLCNKPSFSLFSAETSELLHTTATTATMAVTLSMPNIFPHPLFYSNNFVYEYGHAIFFHHFFLLLSFSIAFSFRFFFYCRFSYFAKSSFYAGTNVFCIYIFAVEERAPNAMRRNARDGGCRNQSGGWRMASGVQSFVRKEAVEIQPEPMYMYTTQHRPDPTEQRRYLS